ncbi:MAG: hypothetical protein FJX84_03940 [Bacteroidetes bacterium]|nr:hypothetical protein [Bacteroidota bacterium]
MKKISLLLSVIVAFGFITTSVAQVPSYIPTNGLAGWWPFNGNANDESGNLISSTVAGATLDTDRFGTGNNSYYFDGNDDTIYVNTQQNNITKYSVSAWFKTSHGGVILSGRGANGQVGLTLRIMNTSLGGQFAGRAEFSTDQPGGLVGVMSNNTFNDNQWHHIVGIFDSNIGAISPSHFKIYVDGNLLSTFNDVSQSANSPINNQTNILFGNQIAWNGATFLGTLDDIGVWNRALTLQEITGLYNVINCANNTSINSQTSALTIGSTASFTASTPDPNPSYIWQSDFGQGFQTLNNFGNYSGTNSPNLNIANVQLANHNQQIRAISTVGNCVDTSNVALLTISNTCTSNVTIVDTVIVNETIYDTITTHITVYDTLTTNIYDTLTTNLTVYDTITTNITVYDTLTTNIYDTTYITVSDTLLTTVTDTLIINTTLSLPAPNNEHTILIYPNPTSDHITIDNGNYVAMTGYSIKITNSSGQQVFQSPINQAQFYLDLSTWTGNGLYFVELIDPLNNTATVRKIVLQ